MIDKSDLIKIARARIRDAEALLHSKRFDGAVYLCGYVVEIALKVRICKTLKWTEWPSSRSDFQKYQTFRTHDFDTLIHLSGIEAKIKKDYSYEWSNVAEWEPGLRYKPIGSATQKDAKMMIESSKVLLSVLL